MDVTEHGCVLGPIDGGGVDEVGVELVLGAGDGDEGVGDGAVNLEVVVELAGGRVGAVRCLDAIRGGDDVLKVDIGESEIAEDGVAGGQAAEAREEGEVHLFRLSAGVVELTVGPISALLHLGDKSLLPPIRHVVHILCSVSLAGVPAVATVTGSAGCSAEVLTESSSSGVDGSSRAGGGADEQGQGGGGGGGERGQRKTTTWGLSVGGGGGR